MNKFYEILFYIWLGLALLSVVSCTVREYQNDKQLDHLYEVMIEQKGVEPEDVIITKDS